MNIEDASTLTPFTRRDARRRTRIAVAAYAICLVALLALGSYLAPSGTIGSDNPGDTGSSLQAR